jgi:hypothetical protein
MGDHEAAAVALHFPREHGVLQAASAIFPTYFYYRFSKTPTEP